MVQMMANHGMHCTGLLVVMRRSRSQQSSEAFDGPSKFLRSSEFVSMSMHSKDPRRRIVGSCRVGQMASSGQGDPMSSGVHWSLSASRIHDDQLQPVVT